MKSSEFVESATTGRFYGGRHIDINEYLAPFGVTVKEFIEFLNSIVPIYAPLRKRGFYVMYKESLIYDKTMDQKKRADIQLECRVKSLAYVEYLKEIYRYLHMHIAHAPENKKQENKFSAKTKWQLFIDMATKKISANIERSNFDRLRKRNILAVGGTLCGKRKR